jgi:hypothetical protein
LAYRKIRKHIHNVTFAEFMDAVFLYMSDIERRDLPIDTGPFVNAVVSYALRRLPEFGELLAKAIATVYAESPSGERFIQDPLHTNIISNNILYLDKDG